MMVERTVVAALATSRNLVTTLAEHGCLRPEAPAIFYYGAEIGYGALWDKVRRLATHLRDRAGVIAGDRVAIDLQNSPHYIIAYYAVLLAGGVVVPLNPMYRAEEVAALLRDAGARVVIAAEDLLDRVRGWEGADALTIVVACYASMLPQEPACALPALMSAPAVDLSDDPRLTGWDDALAEPAGDDLPGLESGADTLAVMPYTSGSTGLPKGCLHTHGSVSYTAIAQAEWYGLTPQSVITAVQPLFHVAGMQGSMNAAIHVGAPLVVFTRWDADAAITLFARHGVTFWNAPPTMVIDMMSRGRAVDAALKRVEIITGGGAAMPQAVSSRLKTEYGLTYIEAYGMSETMSPTHMNPLDAPRVGTVGVPIPDTRALIVDPETLAPLADGAVGELIVTGPQLMQGYWRNPQADAEVFIQHDGRRFLRTGDLAIRDPDGHFRIVDRLKRMINASGFKVWPSEVEGVIFSHEAVLNCCVIASPDPYRGETVKALVQLREGEALAGEDLIAWLRPRLAAFKLPRAVAFVDELPLTASRKVDWRALQEREKAAVAPG